MNNKFLFEHYANMVIEDYDREFSMFKYLGMLTNPEGYSMIEKKLNPTDIKQLTSGQRHSDGEKATEHIQKENQELGIVPNSEEENEGILVV